MGREILIYQSWSVFVFCFKIFPLSTRILSLLSLIFCIFLFAFSNVLINVWYGEMYSSIQNRDTQRFFQDIGIVLSLYGLSVVSSVCLWFLQQKFIVLWRKALLNKMIMNYLEKLSSLPQKIDNPSQRIEQDISLFTQTTIEILSDILQAIITLFFFISILWHLSGVIVIKGVNIHGHLILMAVIYAILGSFIANKIGYPLIHLKSNQEKWDANLRYILIQSEQENHISENKINSSIEKIIHNMNQLIRVGTRLRLWNYSYSKISYLLPIAISAPRFFNNEIDFGDLMRIAPAFGAVSYSLSLLMEKYDTVSKWHAVAGRLNEFFTLFDLNKKI